MTFKGLSNLSHPIWPEGFREVQKGVVVCYLTSSLVSVEMSD